PQAAVLIRPNIIYNLGLAAIIGIVLGSLAALIYRLKIGLTYQKAFSVLQKINAPSIARVSIFGALFVMAISIFLYVETPGIDDQNYWLNSFETCVKSNNFVLTSYPSQCLSEEGYLRNLMIR
ncbi:MAG: hypothetical protein AAF485_20950, partial [Chloroflexota bacterium]